MSENTEFTKGDLGVDDNNLILDVSGFEIAYVKDYQEDTANAHLFAAANKMYAKLEYVNKLLLSLGGEVWDITDLGAESNSIEDLLKQARGEK